MVLRKSAAVVSIILLAVVAPLLYGCGSGPGSGGLERKSAVSLELKWPANYSFNSKTSQLNSASSPTMMAAPAYVTGCSVTISGADMTPMTLDVPLSTGQVGGSVTPGERRFDVVVSTNIGLSFTGSATAMLFPGPNTAITIQLAVNAPPQSSAIIVSNPNPFKEEAVTLTTTATDQDSTDTLSYSWNGGGGSISVSGPSAAWSSAKSGSYTVSVTVTDSMGAATTQSAVITVINRAPVITSVTSSDTAPAVGQTVTLGCVASDPDVNDRLTYSWSDGLGWTAAGASAQYTVATAGALTLTCTVSDGDVSGKVSRAVGLNSVPGATPMLTVTKTADTNDGVCDADCSLREAISASNAGPGGLTIAIPAGRYTITIAGTGENLNATGDFDITKSVSIVGAGAGVTIIDGGALDRVFHITGAYTVSISGVTITGGDRANTGAGGGGIYNRGSLTIANSTISGNIGDAGGGIFSNGALTITNSTVSGNSGNTFSGGGILSNNPLTITNSTISGNSAAWGGGVYNSSTGTLIINNSTISGNSGNNGGGGNGGGIYSGGTVTITNSTISGNLSGTGFAGGGIYNSGGALTVTNSTISGNTAVSAAGGGIDNSGTLAIVSSTISGNLAGSDGGGIDNFGVLTIINSTISGNTAVSAGGFIYNFGTLTVTNSTISGNTGLNAGGIYNAGGATSISNSIVAKQTAGSDCLIVGGTITSSGHNLERVVSCGFAGVGDLQNTDPLLGALANNGGPTQTMAPAGGSPAIDAGSCVTPTDQRGIARPQGGFGLCDIGAYEQ